MPLVQFGAGGQRDAPDDVCDGQATQPSQVISMFGGPRWEESHDDGRGQPEGQF